MGNEKLNSCRLSTINCSTHCKIYLVLVENTLINNLFSQTNIISQKIGIRIGLRKILKYDYA